MRHLTMKFRYAARAFWNFWTSPTGAFILAVSAIALGYYQFYVSRPILRYQTNTVKLISSNNTNEYAVDVKGKKYKDLYLTKVYLYNQGEQALSGTDVSHIGHDPIRIEVPKDAMMQHYNLDNDETNTNVPKPVNMPSKAFIYCLVPYYFQLKKKNLSGEQLISRINKDVFDKDVIYDVNLVDKYFFYLLTYEYFELSKFKEGFKFAANLKNDPRLGPLFGRYILKDRFRNQLAKSIFRYDLSNIRKASYLNYDNLEHCKITEKQILLLRKDKYNVKRNMPVRLPSIFELLNKHMTNSEVEKSIKELLITKDFVAVVRTLDEVIKSEKEPK